jgi:hypothetical protein
MSLSASTFLSLALIGVPSYFSPRRRRSSSFATVLLTCSERPDQFCFFHVSGGFTVENSCKPHPVIANNGMGFAATTLMTKHTEDHDSIAEHTEDHDSQLIPRPASRSSDLCAFSEGPRLSLGLPKGSILIGTVFAMVFTKRK